MYASCSKCLQSLACEICPAFIFHSVLVGMLSSRVVLMFLLSFWQASLANEKNMLAGQVKKLLRDVAKVVSIKAIWTAELCFQECVSLHWFCSLSTLLWKYWQSNLFL